MDEIKSPITIIAPTSKSSSDYLISGSYDALVPCAQKLNSKGIIAVGENDNGSYRLRVVGVKSPADLANLLGEASVSAQFAEGSSVQKAQRNVGGLTKWFNENKIKVVGIANSLGDLSMFASGIASKRTKESATGLIYITGGVVGAYYGDPSVNRQIKNVGKELGRFMQSIGADIGENTALHTLAPGKSFNPVDRVNRFLYDHPSETLNGILAVGGTQLLQSGLRKRASSDPAQRAGWMQDSLAGSLVTTAGATGALIPESKKDMEGKSKGGITAWIKDKPLRLAGGLYLANNFLLLGSAWQEAKKNPQQKSYIFKFMAATFFLIANASMAMSSRHSPSSKENAETKKHMVGGMAAEVIAAQPDENKRMEMIAHVSQFLSERHETRQEIGEWEQVLKDKVNALLGARKDMPATGTQTTPAKDSHPQTDTAKGTATWQEKVATAPELTVTPQRM